MNKVCIVTTVHSPYDDRIYYKEALTLAGNGFSILLIGPAKNSRSLNNVTFRAIPVFSNKLFRIALAPFYVLPILLKENFQICHIHDPEIFYLGIFLKLFKNCRVIIDIHENYHRMIRQKTPVKKSMSEVLLYLYKRYEKICFKFAYALIGAVPDILHNYEDFTNLKKQVICNYPEQWIYSKRKIGSNLKTKQFIYIGEVAYDRGISELIGAFKMISNDFKDATLLFVGPIKLSPADLSEYKNIRNVRFTGKILREAAIRHIRKSVAGLCILVPKDNYLYSYPVKIFEYMACGIPVIASNFPILNEFLLPHGCGVTVNPNNITEIYNKMLQILQYPVKSRGMGQRGRLQVVRRYNWSGESKKLLKLYQQND